VAPVGATYVALIHRQLPVPAKMRLVYATLSSTKLALKLIKVT